MFVRYDEIKSSDIFLCLKVGVQVSKKGIKRKKMQGIY